MTLSEQLGSMADRLVPVAGYLMHVACSNGRVAEEPDEHEVGCECRCCLVFLTVQNIQNELEGIIRGMK